MEKTKRVKKKIASQKHGFSIALAFIQNFCENATRESRLTTEFLLTPFACSQLIWIKVCDYYFNYFVCSSDNFIYTRVCMRDILLLCGCIKFTKWESRKATKWNDLVTLRSRSCRLMNIVWLLMRMMIQQLSYIIYTIRCCQKGSRSAGKQTDIICGGVDTRVKRCHKQQSKTHRSVLNSRELNKFWYFPAQRTWNHVKFTS